MKVSTWSGTPGYHYVVEHYTLNGCENPRYEPNA
jgi:hypothetical protein